MLPVGAGLITLRDTVVEAMNFFEQIKVVPQQDSLAETCRKLLQQDTATSEDDDDEDSDANNLVNGLKFENMGAGLVALYVLARREGELLGLSVPNALSQDVTLSATLQPITGAYTSKEKQR
ncbi:hypothetical protein JHK87_019259 [Glycine soja]|nr:hypothetical protein JHK87_019259 [Glycine soja]